ncbi:hypothetical protein RN001_015465 [Aquatica leii]|uniref:AB hydrolase-1 domain-containing protein n=1 Tax=Aquatica leii TaxID=1421715 RepID=A0AAN7S6N7_9COLE|nr:hypothetical protein RN001_015465 [Aquatica leii]
MHGLFGTSRDFIIMGPERGLGYLLADKGYDVWIGNARGSEYSRKHAVLNPDFNPEYWDFSFHEIGYYDLPAVLNLIKQTTKKNQISYIGNSMGTTVFYVLTSERPTYNKNFNVMIALAPSAYMSHMSNPLIKALASISDYLNRLGQFLGFNEIPPKGFGRLLGLSSEIFCQKDSPFIEYCRSIFFLIGGFNPEQLNKSAVVHIFRDGPSPVSRLQLVHFAQSINFGYFRHFDFGPSKNVQKYGKTKPPIYDLSRISVPVNLFYSKGDVLCTPKTMRVLVIVCFIRSVFSMTCQEEMVYQRVYGYIYSITCSNLNDTNVHELNYIVTYNQVRLTIDNSILTNITSDTFKNIPNTIELVIKNSLVSQLYFIPKTLKLLSLVNNSLTTLQNDFGNSHYLRSINLSHNALNTFPLGILHESIEELDLSHNKYENFDVKCEVTQTIRLRLSYNRIKTLDQFPFKCLPLLNHLYLDFNDLAQLPQFESLSYLTKLFLNNNDISKIDDAFLGLENLNELNLAHNKILIILANDFRDLHQLKTLNLQHNALHNITLPKINLIELNLENNNLKLMPNLTLSALKKLRVSHNTFLNVNFESFGKLTHLSLSNCSIGTLNAHLQNLKDLEFLDLSFNALDLDKNTFSGLENLRELDLSWNRLGLIPSLTFSSQSNLEKLNLSHNSFKDLTEIAFADLLELRVLDLSFNRLEHITDDVFTFLRNLQQLYLSHNQLAFIEYNSIVSRLRKVRVFDIRYNNFSCQFLIDLVRYFNVSRITFGTRLDENQAGFDCEKIVSSSNLTSAVLIVVIMFLILSSIIIFIARRYFRVLLTNINSEEIQLTYNSYCYRPRLA